MRIAIVGGSISGLAAAVLLLKEGHEVTVFEQHVQNLVDQGAGITITKDVYDKLIQSDILNANTPIVQINKRQIIRNNNNQEDIICGQYFSAYALHWQTLYTALRKKIPNEKIKAGYYVRQIEGTTLTVVHQNVQTQETFNLILGADGHHSLTAKTICQNIPANYAGYIAWRGTTPYLPSMSSLFGNTDASQAVYFVYPHGHCLMYLIHTPDTQEVWVNWVFYEKRNAATLIEALPFNHEREQYQTVARGQLPPAQKNYLQQLATQLPLAAQTIIHNTRDPFIQPIYAIRPHLRTDPQGKIALLGDAAGTLPPQAGSGAVKGLTDAWQIVAAIKAGQLKTWGPSRKTEDENLYTLATRMQDFWVLKTPDWQQLNSNDFEEMWKKLMSNQEWYTPPKPRL